MVSTVKAGLYFVVLLKYGSMHFCMVDYIYVWPIFHVEDGCTDTMVRYGLQ